MFLPKRKRQRFNISYIPRKTAIMPKNLIFKNNLKVEG